ncbi:MAG: hypothetical protein K2H98_01340, partial [Duncaniella sp.]|nr:hypothetical protein [Duncaniella sp.]
YRHTVICGIPDDTTGLIEKEHIIEYTLINPYSVNQKAIDYIKFTNHVLIEGDRPQDAIKDLKILCTVDNFPQDDLSESIELISEDIREDFYNKKLILVEKDRNDKHEGIRIEFNDQIKVTMRYKIKVPSSDLCFTKRLKHPAENFRLDYTCIDQNTKLYGQLFGTEIKQSNISINYTGSSISIETFDWLLPGNGAMVIMLKK